MEREIFRSLMPNDLIAAHGLRKFGLSQVEFNLAGTSCLEFLKTVNDWHSLFARRPYVTPKQLELWAQDARFTEQLPTDASPVRVEGVVEKSHCLSRAEQEARGLELASMPHLVAAHAAFLLLTQRDLFDGAFVRAQDGVLAYSSGLGLYAPALSILGVDIASFFLNTRRADVFGSRYLEELRYPPPAW